MRKSKPSYYLFKVEVGDSVKNIIRVYYVYSIENNPAKIQHFAADRLDENKSNGFHYDVTRIYEDDLRNLGSREEIYNADIEWKYNIELFNKIIDY